MNVLASKRVAGGLIVKVACRSCQHAFWTSGNQPRSECADCNPPETVAEERHGIGRNMDRKRSDHQFHGCYQE